MRRDKVGGKQTRDFFLTVGSHAQRPPLLPVKIVLRIAQHFLMHFR
jgi:hypothetical protein